MDWNLASNYLKRNSVTGVFESSQDAHGEEVLATVVQGGAMTLTMRGGPRYERMRRPGAYASFRGTNMRSMAPDSYTYTTGMISEFAKLCNRSSVTLMPYNVDVTIGRQLHRRGSLYFCLDTRCDGYAKPVSARFCVYGGQAVYCEIVVDRDSGNWLYDALALCIRDKSMLPLTIDKMLDCEDWRGVTVPRGWVDIAGSMAGLRSVVAAGTRAVFLKSLEVQHP